MPEGIGRNKTGGFGVVVTGPHVDEAGGIGAVTAPGVSRGDRPAGFDGLWRVEVLTVGVVIPVVPYGGLAARREGGEDMAEGIVNQAGGVGALPQGDQAPDTMETTVAAVEVVTVDFPSGGIGVHLEGDFKEFMLRVVEGTDRAGLGGLWVVARDRGDKAGGFGVLENHEMNTNCANGLNASTGTQAMGWRVGYFFDPR